MSAADSHYDCLIIGAGPAGCSAALHATRLGLRVLLLEKSRFPRDKLCGDSLSSQALILLEELGLLQELMRQPHLPVFRTSFYAPSGASVTIPLLGLDPSLPVKGLICRRVILDSMLMDAVRACADVRDWCAVRKIVRDADGRPRGVVAEQGGSRTFTATAEAIIAADGTHSLFVRQMGLPRYPELRAVAARAYFRYVLGPVGTLEFHFPEELLPGLLWIYPTESGLTNVGLSLSMDALRRKRIRPRQALLELVHSPQLIGRFAHAELVGKVEAAIQPVGKTLRCVHGAGYLLTGDAAGLANACSGEGVGPALLSGKLAAQAVAGGSLDEQGLRSYPLSLWRELGPMLRLADSLLELRTTRAVNDLVNSARRRPHNAGWISGILTGLSLPSEELNALLGYLRLFRP